MGLSQSIVSDLITMVTLHVCVSVSLPFSTWRGEAGRPLCSAGPSAPGAVPDLGGPDVNRLSRGVFINMKDGTHKSGIGI